MTTIREHDVGTSRSIAHRGARSRTRFRSTYATVVFALTLAFAVARSPTSVRADGALETETARVLERGRWQVGLAAEIQLAGEGREIAIPAAVEVGLGRNFEFLVEPVFFTGIYPERGSKSTGLGDTELTLTHLAIEETYNSPAFAVAAEAKLPTARNRLIGTGKIDFAGYLIASKKWRDFDFHVNVGYTVVGQSPGEGLDNIFNFAIATEYRLRDRVDLVAELLASTSAGGGESTTAPEASGGELIGSAGFRYRFNEEWSGYFVASYDNSNAVGIRVGMTWKF